MQPSLQHFCTALPYEVIANDPTVDLVVHPGNYIDEYGPEGDGGPTGLRIGRDHESPHETVTLADYRQRHARYKNDAGSKAMHARHPLVVLWDDRETANDPWLGAAQRITRMSKGTGLRGVTHYSRPSTSGCPCAIRVLAIPVLNRSARVPLQLKLHQNSACGKLRRLELLSSIQRRARARASRVFDPNSLPTSTARAKNRPSEQIARETGK